MGLYTRKEYQSDCEQIDAQIARSASLLGQQLIGPLEHWQRARMLDELKRKLGQKLAMTAIALKDKSNMERSTRFAWVIGAKKVHESEDCKKKGFCNCRGEWYVAGKKEPLIKHNSPHYRSTSLGEILELQNEGVTVMESGFMKRGKSQNAKQDEEEAILPLQWVECTEAEALRLQDEGDVVEVNEKLGLVEFHAHYMIRGEGEGEQRKFYYADVR